MTDNSLPDGFRSATDIGSFTEDCPYCRTSCTCDLADVGVGYQQIGPYHCTNCGASEIGPHDDERLLTDEEKRHGWYAPGAEPGSSANVIAGRIVDSHEMEDAYRTRFAGAPAAWAEPGRVEQWFEDIRKKT